MPADAQVKNESVPAMPAGSYVKKEEEGVSAIPAADARLSACQEGGGAGHAAGRQGQGGGLRAASCRRHEAGARAVS